MVLRRPPAGRKHLGVASALLLVLLLVSGSGSPNRFAMGTTPVPSNPPPHVVGTAATPLTHPPLDGPSYYASYTITFQPSGIPGGWQWGISIDGGGPSFQAGSYRATFQDYVYTIHHFRIYPCRNYVPTTASGNLSVADNGSTIYAGYSLAPTFPVNFSETGLPGGSTWGVVVAWGDVPGAVGGNSSGRSVVLNLRSDPYTFDVRTPFGYHFPAPVVSDSFVVNGTNRSVAVPLAAGEYRVAFAESGLPNGTGWSVLWNSVPTRSVNSSIYEWGNNSSDFYAIPTTHAWAATPAGGLYNITGVNSTLPVRFAYPRFPVTLQEAGLPPGAAWSAALDGFGESSSGNTVNWSEPNGTYNFTIRGYAGYTAGNYAGTVTVDGLPVNFTVNWSATTYDVEVRETGLPAGTGWSVTARNQSVGTHADTVTIALPNGTWVLRIVPPDSYSASPVNLTVTVVGRNVSETVQFSPNGTGLPFGISVVEFAGIVVAAGAVAVLLSLLLLRPRNRRGGPSPRRTGGPPARPKSPG